MDWEALSFRYEFWLLVAGALMMLQFLTDEFFFGGASIGALLTAIVLGSLGAGVASGVMNASIPYVMCGAGGLIGATLIRQACQNRQEPPDINDEPYRGDDT